MDITPSAYVLLGVLLGVCIGLFMTSHSPSCSDLVKVDESLPQPIPRRVIQTTHLAHVPTRISKLYRNVERIVFDDAQVAQYLQAHCHPRVFRAFQRIELGAHKMDLFRYCYLYREGGIYLDIKTFPVDDINATFPDVPGTYTWYTALGSEEANSPDNECIYNAIIATPPRNPIMLHMVRHIVDVVERGKPYQYLAFIKENYRLVLQKYGATRAGVHVDDEGRRLVLFQEKISLDPQGPECMVPIAGLETRTVDARDLCSNVYDANGALKLIGRDPEYPWNQ